jgi:hypothetical protein
MAVVSHYFSRWKSAMPPEEQRPPRRSDVAVTLVSLSLLAMLFAPSSRRSRTTRAEILV